MTVPDAALIEAIRVVVAGEIVTVHRRLDILTERVDVLAGRVDGIFDQVASLTERFDEFLERMERLEARVERLEALYETLEARTSQISIDLQLLAERVEQGFRSIREDITVLSSMIVKLDREQGYQWARLGALEERVDDLQRRVERLEQAQEE